MIKKLSTVFFLCLAVTLTACSSKPPKTENIASKVTNEAIKPKESTVNTPPNANTQNKTVSTVKKVFTLDELKKYNGENGTPAYVAIDGVVYDVTNNDNWQNGKHEGVAAGNDLSGALNSSPHGKSVLEKLPIVGTLKK